MKLGKSKVLIFWIHTKILNTGSHDLALLSVFFDGSVFTVMISKETDSIQYNGSCLKV